MSTDQELHVDEFFRDFLEKSRKVYRDVVQDPLQFAIIGAAILIGSYFAFPGLITGILLGLYVAINLQFLSKNESKTEYDIGPNIHAEKIEKILPNGDVVVMKEELVKASEVQESTARIVPPIYRGWINILNERYDAMKFNVDHVQTVLIRIEGNLLFLGTPEHSLRKHAFHEDPTFTNPEPGIIRETYYDLTDAKVRRGASPSQNIARRRWFSRKYPICIKVSRAYNSVFDDPQEIHTQTASEDEYDSDYEEEVVDAQLLTPVTTTIEKEGIEIEQHPVVSAEAVHGVAELAMEPNPDGYASDEEEEAMVDEEMGDILVKKKNRRKRATRVGKYRNLYLFGRSAREKERWFHKLREVVSKYSTTETNTASDEVYKEMVEPSSTNLNDNPPDDYTSDFVLYMLQNTLYEKALQNSLGKPFEIPNGIDKFGIADMNLGNTPWQQDPEFHSSTQFVNILNLVTARVLFDVARDENLYKSFEKLIQQKIATIHLPSFITTLTLNHLDIGTASPKITNIYEPIIDEWGIWLDFEVKYEGSVKLIIETRADMSKLGMKQEEKLESEENRPVPSHIKPRHYWDEEVPESLETSPDEDFGSPTQNGDHGPRNKKFTKKLVSAVKKIAHSKVVQDIKDLTLVKKMTDVVADQPVHLNVDIKEFSGRMVINIPPPPSDRIWWAFRTSPHTKAEGVPQLGSVHIPALSDAIVKLVYSLLEHHLVWPNMEDVSIPMLQGNKIFKQTFNQ